MSDSGRWYFGISVKLTVYGEAVHDQAKDFYNPVSMVSSWLLV